MFVVVAFALCQMPLLVPTAPVRLLRSPCPEVFHYEKVRPEGSRDWIFPSEDHRWRGVIEVPPSLPISLRVKLLTPVALPSKYVGRIELAEDKSEIVHKINLGTLRVIKYFIYFPAKIPIPEMVLIEVNSRVVCSQTPAPRRLKTILTLEHSLVPITTNVSTRGGIGAAGTWKAPVKGAVREKSLNVSGECGRSVTRSPSGPRNVSTSSGDWPWMVPLFKKTELGLQFLCSSTLVSSEFVVTAAHCIKLKNAKALNKEDIVAYPGRFDISNWTEENAQPREVIRIVLHPDFDPNTLHSDLALLKFSKAVEFTSKVGPACLWRGEDDLEAIVGKRGVVSGRPTWETAEKVQMSFRVCLQVFGWGADGLGRKVTPTPNLAVMPIASQEECLRSKMEFLFLTSNRTLCAGFRNGTGPCNGDSGGGLLLPTKSEDGGFLWFLRGVVSLSLLQDAEIMCDVEEYTVFTDVAKYRDWISQQMSV